MNFLAHLHLAYLTGTSPVGNLLGDFVKGPVPDALPSSIATGIRLHRSIDGFTDAHPEHRAAVRAFEAPWRRYGGILVDVLYDHLLSRHWARFEVLPMRTFLDNHYQALFDYDAGRAGHAPALPPVLIRMAEQDWLSSYAEVADVQRALDGIGRRLRQPVPLGDGVESLDQARWMALEAGFLRFYPELMAFAVKAASTGERGESHG